MDGRNYFYSIIFGYQRVALLLLKKMSHPAFFVSAKYYVALLPQVHDFKIS